MYTRYKREKVVRKWLEEKQIECYLPLQEYTRHYTRKVVKVELPLISCYLFVKITKSEYVPTLEVPDVVKFVRFSRNLIAIPEEEIDLIRRVVGEITDIEVTPSSFQVGDQVEIIGGNLTGLQGKLLQQSGKNNFLLELNSLGYQMRMHVDPKLLRKIRGTAKI